MTGIRLLMAISLVCSVSAFAQVQDDSATPSNQAATFAKLSSEAAGATAMQNSSQFKIDKLSDPFLASQNNAQSPMLSLESVPQNSRADEILLKLNYGERAAKLNADGRMAVPGLQDDSLCYAIRSYVVARDNKDSDSVHPVGYTTCVPASRYQLRTTVEHQTSDGESHLIQR